METNKEDWQSFFDGAQIVLSAVERSHNLLRLRLGIDFNVFDWIKPAENTLSNIVRDLLDPKGSHGHGSTFLKLALDHIISTPDPVSSDQLEECSVIREALTFNRRLIDLVINFGNCGIGIENKPSAAQQVSQLDDYADHLERQFKGSFCLVFLHGPGMSPTSLSPVKKEQLRGRGRFLEVPYNANSGPSFHRWLVLCAEAAQSEKIRQFLKDFAEYVANEFTLFKEESY